MFTRLLLAVIVLCVGGIAQAADATSAWKIEQDTDGITVSTRAVAGSPHRAVLARMQVATPIAELVALVRDTTACVEWAQFCKASREQEVISETEAYIYTLNDLPWPVTDREALSHVTWHFDPATGAVRMEAVAVDGRLERKSGRVRLTDARTSWTFRPLADGKADGMVEVISEAHVDPAGPIPAWITNRLLVDAPFRTLQKMRALAATGRYAGSSFAFMDDRSRHSR